MEQEQKTLTMLSLVNSVRDREESLGGSNSEEDITICTLSLARDVRERAKSLVRNVIFAILKRSFQELNSLLSR